MSDLIIVIFQGLFVLGYFGAMWVGYTNASGALGKGFFLILGLGSLVGLLSQIKKLATTDQESSSSLDDINYRASDNYNDWIDDGDSGE
jgi:hypothetical protein|tara:strand:+ start:832 stop:1098 length:267 start_codon:yes stop_codon:yes gene_type:complete